MIIFVYPNYLDRVNPTKSLKEEVFFFYMYFVFISYFPIILLSEDS